MFGWAEPNGGCGSPSLLRRAGGPRRLAAPFGIWRGGNGEDHGGHGLDCFLAG
jgi:hypothetical protein